MEWLTLKKNSLYIGWYNALFLFLRISSVNRLKLVIFFLNFRDLAARNVLVGDNNIAKVFYMALLNCLLHTCFLVSYSYLYFLPQCSDL